MTMTPADYRALLGLIAYLDAEVLRLARLLEGRA